MKLLSDTRIAACHVRGGDDAKSYGSAIEFKTVDVCARTLVEDDVVEQTLVLEDASALKELLEELGDTCLLLTHTPRLLARFVRQFSEHPTHMVLDVRELAALCFPEAPCSSWSLLARDMNLHGSASLQILELWERCLAALSILPPPLISILYRLVANRRRHPIRNILKEIHDICATRSKSKLGSLLQDLPRPRRTAKTEEERSVSANEIRDLFSDTGPFAAHLPNYEPREQQAHMAAAIAAALNGKQHLLVEAGTGVGKSLAYLVPSIYWSKLKHEPVVVSTNTKNLQSQLFEKDIPLLRDILELDFKAAIIKGRRNYVCLRRLNYLIEHADVELDADQRLEMTALVNWAVHTADGDLSKLAAVSPGLLRQASSIAEDCSGRECSFYRKCFLYAARARSLAADVIVSNHSVVFAEMGLDSQSPVLPEYRQIVFDEAHNLEDAATSGFSKEISTARLQFSLNKLWRQKGRKARGLIPALLKELSREDQENELVLLAQEAADNIANLIIETSSFIKPFFTAMVAILTDSKGRVHETVRILPGVKSRQEWLTLIDIREPFVGVLQLVGECANALASALSDLPDDLSKRFQEYCREIRAVALWLGEFSTDLSFVLDSTDPNYVCWMEKTSPRQGGARAWAAPIEVGQELNKHLYQKKDSVIFTSATLAVQNSVQFLKQRLGIDLVPSETVQEVGLGTPFNYQDQCQAMIPTFLPEPSERELYSPALAELIGDVVALINGRTLALFTSYEMLRQCGEILQHRLASDDIAVLIQGQTGTREAITESFKQDRPSILLGTHSFWEGVDIVGDKLSCVIMARLPFAVFADPIIDARCKKIEEAGGNAFQDYSIPNAVIRFRQGFGRLIRHRDDRGVVIFADRRLVSRRYGQAFYGSLPLQCYTYSEPNQLLDGISAFLR